MVANLLSCTHVLTRSQPGTLAGLPHQKPSARYACPRKGKRRLQRAWLQHATTCIALANVAIAISHPIPGRPWTLQPQARRLQRLSSWLQKLCRRVFRKMTGHSILVVYLLPGRQDLARDDQVIRYLPVGDSNQCAVPQHAACQRRRDRPLRRQG